MPVSKHVAIMLLLSCCCPSSGQQARRNLPDDLAKLQIRMTTPHYELAGTLSRQQLEKYGRALEFIYAEYSRGFEGLIRSKRRGDADNRQDARLRVVFLATDAQYEEFGRAYFGQRAEHTRGLYVYAQRLLLISASGTEAETVAVMFHEAFHQFLHRFVPAAPIWLHEGLATYYQTARSTPAGLVFDRPVWAYRNIVLSAANKKVLISFEDLFTYDEEAFYDPTIVSGLNFRRRDLAYAQAYTLCKYLLREQSGRSHLQRYIEALAQVRSVSEAKRVSQESWPPNLLRALGPQWLDSVKRWR